MRINTHLDVEVVALEHDDAVTVLLEMQAPEATSTEPRPEHTVVVCLDRSGSMAGPRLEAAREALLALVDRLDERDRFGLVSFDDAAVVEVPAAPLRDLGRAAVRAAIRRIEPGGMTDLSSGYLTALREAKSAAGATGATVVLLSDGHANAGVVDPTALRSVAAEAQQDRSVTTSTIGIGLGYDERILAAMAEGGSGNHSMAEQPEAAAVALAGEVAGLLAKTVQAAALVVRPGSGVTGVHLLNDLPAHAVGGEIRIGLGDFYAGETRRLLLRIDVPAMPALGTVPIAELELRYVELPALVESTVRWPVAVNVVPGDEAAGRVPAPEVERERLLLEVQSAKRESEEALRRGDVGAAYGSLSAAADLLAAAPPAMASEDFDDEARWFAESLESLDTRDVSYNAKRMQASRSRRSRGHGERGTGGEVR